jgi:hypothetical protein
MVEKVELTWDGKERIHLDGNIVAKREALSFANIGSLKNQFHEYPILPGDTLQRNSTYLVRDVTYFKSTIGTIETILAEVEVKATSSGTTYKTTLDPMNHTYTRILNSNITFDFDDLFGEDTQEIDLGFELKSPHVCKRSSSPMQLLEKGLDWWYYCTTCGSAMVQFDKLKK